MSHSSLKIIPVIKLQCGMFVNSVAESTNNIPIKAHGLIVKEETITLLKEKGVKAVIVDMSKSNIPDGERKTILTKDKRSIKQEVKTSFEVEIEKAKTLIFEGKKIQQTLFDAIKTNTPLKKHIPQTFAKEIVKSIDRNPNALLCMTKIREKDEYLLEHSLNVSILLAHFGFEFDMSLTDIEELAYAGFVHDIGKIKVPDKILHKPNRLTEAEMSIMKLHVNYGVEALQDVGVDPEVIQTMSEHHERLDGKGYPLGKSNDDISLHGRMIAIVDVYDALTANRVYKPGMTSQKALQILLNDCPNKYDEFLVQKFIKCIGVYPIGSLVLLSNKRIGVVLEQNSSNLTSPKVRVFFSTLEMHYLEAKDIDLKINPELSIEKAVIASEYGMDLKAIFEKYVLY